MKARPPHRLRTGACRCCGHFDATSAPRTCTWCAVQVRFDRGGEVMLDPALALASYDDQRWLRVVDDMATGWVKSDRFYVYVGEDDDGPLGLPLGSERPEGEVFPTVTQAGLACARWAARYPEVWVVTTAGCWRPTIRLAYDNAQQEAAS